MSTLTKVFIVLLVVFCIAFTMSSISFVAQTHEWKSLAEGFQQEARTSETHMRNVLALTAAELATSRDAIEDHINTIAGLEKDYQNSMGQIGDLEAQLAKANAQVSGLEGSVRLLGGELKVGQAGWAAQREQRADLEQRNIELETRNVDLNERVNEQTAQVLVLEQHVRQLEQQIHILEEENRQFSQYQRRAAAGDLDALADAGRGAARPLTPVAVSPIRGKIVDVSGGLATVSVGAADGVVEGMVFVIYRGLDYIGDLKITHVEPSQCAGRVTRSSGTPKTGDRVADEAQFGMAE